MMDCKPVDLEWIYRFQGILPSTFAQGRFAASLDDQLLQVDMDLWIPYADARQDMS